MSLFRAGAYNNAINYLKIDLENIELNNEEMAVALYYLSQCYSLTKDYQNGIIVSKSAINAFEALNNRNKYLEEIGTEVANSQMSITSYNAEKISLHRYCTVL